MPQSLAAFTYQPDNRERRLLAELNGTRKPARRWSRAERIVLMTIHRWLYIEALAVPLTLNHYFNIPPGSRQEFTAVSCTVQAAEIRRSDTENVYTEVFNQDFQSLSASISRILTRIVQSARLARVDIRRKSREGRPGRGRRALQLQRQREERHTAINRPDNRLNAPTHSQPSRSVTLSATDFLPIDDPKPLKIEKSELELIDLTLDENILSTSPPDSSPPIISSSFGSLSITSISSRSTLEDFRELSTALEDTPCPAARQPRLKQDFPRSSAAKSIANVEADISTVETPAILLRVYSASSGGTNDLQHFRAGYFDGLTDEIPDPSSSTDDFFINYIGRHLRRDHFPSPFISFSPSIIWIIHKAFQTKRDRNIAAEQVYIAMVDSSAITRNRIWHAKPLLSEVRELNDRKFWPCIYSRYNATQEWIVYGEVNQSHSTNTLAEVLRLANHHASVSAILRLDEIETKRSIGSLRKGFLSQAIVLEDTIIIGLAKILLFLGVTPACSIAVIEAGVHAIIQGWAIKIEREEILAEACGQWIYYFFQKVEEQALEPQAPLENGKIGSARDAFIAGAMRARE